MLTEHLKDNGNKWLPVFTPFRRFINAGDWIRYGYSIYHETEMRSERTGDYPDPPWYP